ncbi:MAG: transglycosylase domain-containing protein, partial [Marinomonas sp.]|uniref:transglycosylase domain-containing protein n=1 Tax=Marinomonas sp. TaxID=1904862 RepID=UPI003C78A5FE
MAKRKPGVFNKAWRILWRVLIAFALILLVFRFVPPPTTAFMLQSDYPVTQHWISIDKLPPQVPLAVIGSEDQRFPDHFGVDFTAITKALSQYDDGEGLRGASTITQQTAK